MSVACPRCGRGYDVALFQFGRTLHCTCGARVGRELRRAAGQDGELRFVADAMLGRLARWLRVLGYDTAYAADVGDEELVRQAVHERRVLLTRDRSLPEEWWIEPVVVIEQEAPLAQLREVAEAVGLTLDRALFTRCTMCNARLESASRASVGERVPERIRREQTRFARCPDCGRVYWEGSHTARMRRVLARVRES